MVIFSLAVGVHRSMEAASRLAEQGVDTSVVDLRTVAPLDVELICATASDASAVMVVDEDYLGFGLSGEIAAVLAEQGIRSPFARVATEGVIPYARRLECQVLPSVDRILDAAGQLIP